MRAAKKFWKWWQKTGLIIGNFVSGVVLTVFYYTIFPFFAVPFRLFGKNPLGIPSANSSWLTHDATADKIGDFELE